MARKWKQGIFQVKNTDKFIGTKMPVFRSSYEYAMFQWLDRSPAVLKWGSECVIVKYYNPVKKKMCRYYVDIFLQYTDKDNKIRTDLIEIKPVSQVNNPVRGKKRQDLYEGEVLEFMINNAKWDAARDYAAERGWDFKILTENQIFRG